MFLISFFTWWYGAGWMRLPREIRQRIRYITQFFSLTIILKTLFAPWKRDIAYATSPALEDRFNALIGNLVSRFIGFLIRIFFMIGGVCAIVCTAVGGTVLFVIWPILPVLPIVLIAWGLM